MCFVLCSDGRFYYDSVIQTRDGAASPVAISSTDLPALVEVANEIIKERQVNKASGMGWGGGAGASEQFGTRSVQVNVCEWRCGCIQVFESLDVSHELACRIFEGNRFVRMAFYCCLPVPALCLFWLLHVLLFLYVDTSCTSSRISSAPVRKYGCTAAARW